MNTTKIICSRIANSQLKFNIFFHLCTTSIIMKEDVLSIEYYQTMFNLN